MSPTPTVHSPQLSQSPLTRSSLQWSGAMEPSNLEVLGVATSAHCRDSHGPDCMNKTSGWNRWPRDRRILHLRPPWRKCSLMLSFGEWRRGWSLVTSLVPYKWSTSFSSLSSTGLSS